MLDSNYLYLCISVYIAVIEMKSEKWPLGMEQGPTPAYGITTNENKVFRTCACFCRS